MGSSSPAPEALLDDDAEIAAYVSRVEARNRAVVPALSAFQQQMDRYKPLPVDQQQVLVNEYRRGQLAKELLAEGLTGPAADAAQAEVRRGEYALEHLIGSMMKLTLLIARENAEERYGRERASDLLPDLVAEANLALTEAAASYDEARCPSFSIYAGRVVRDRVRMILARDTPIKLPPSWVRIKRIAAVRLPVLHSDLGRAPTKKEIQADLLARCMEWAQGKLTPEQLELSLDEQRDIKLAKLRKQGMLAAIESIEDVLVATQTIASLDTPVGDEGGASLGDLLSNPTKDSTFDNVELDQLKDALRAALEPLAQREREILMFRFGFVDGDQWTYQRICEKYNVTAERIRQIERNVLAKLRAGTAGVKLQTFLPNRMEAAEAEYASTAGSSQAPVRRSLRRAA